MGCICTACTACCPPHALGFAAQLFLSPTDVNLLTRLIRKIFLYMLPPRAKSASNPFSSLFSPGTPPLAGTPGLARTSLPTHSSAAPWGKMRSNLVHRPGQLDLLCCVCRPPLTPGQLPLACGPLVTWGVVPKGEANQLRFLPAVGKAALSLRPIDNGSVFSLLTIPFSENF